MEVLEVEVVEVAGVVEVVKLLKIYHSYEKSIKLLINTRENKIYIVCIKNLTTL